MCSNYRPVTRMDRLLTFFGVERDKDEEPHDVFPTDMAPFIRLSIEGQEGGRPALVAEDGMFGLLPNFATELSFGRRTYNARSETVATLPSFRQRLGRGPALHHPGRGGLRALLRERQGRALAHLAGRRRADGHRRPVPPLAQPQGRRAVHVHDDHGQRRRAIRCTGACTSPATRSAWS